ncbi:MAG: SufE family protein [Pseudomonadota bacterium]
MPASEAFEEIVDNFSLFDEWEDRYRYVIDLGKDLPELDVARRTSATKVDGCASQVWLVPDLRVEGGDRRLYFEGDSDAMIVRGLIAVLITLISGRSISEIQQLDIRAELARLQLDQALSAQRSNGLRAMVARIEEIANSSAAA